MEVIGGRKCIKLDVNDVMLRHALRVGKAVEGLNKIEPGNWNAVVLRIHTPDEDNEGTLIYVPNVPPEQLGF